jgi:HEAT repeat protein
MGISLFGLSLWFLASSGFAQTAVATPAVPPVTPTVLLRTGASSGQPALAVGRRGDALIVAVCRGVCDWEAGVDLQAPPELVPQLAKANFRILRLGGGHTAIWVSSNPVREDPSAGWQAVVAAPLSGLHPVVAFAGVSGLTQGEPGARTGTGLQLFESRTSTDVVVGSLREDVQICGRPSLLSPKVLHAADVRLRGVKLQRLTQAERDAAPRLSAQLNPQPAEQAVLTALSASSAIGDLSALTDGDFATTWSEQRGGDGSGEFVVFDAPPSVPLTEIHFRVRPTADAAPGAAPKELWVATDHKLFHVTLPEQAGSPETAPGAVFSVALPEPIATSCVALVLGSAFAESGAVDVTLAEVSASTKVQPAELERAAQALGGQDPAALAALRLLAAFGTTGHSAVRDAFIKLPERGRLRALSILDQASCADAVLPYAVAVDGTGSPLHRQGERGLLRCGAQAPGALRGLLGRAHGERLRALGNLFVQLAPVEALNAAVTQLEQSGARRRLVLREMITKTLEVPEALATARAWLADPELGEKAAIDLLRACEGRLVELQPAAASRVHGLLAGDATFRTRYLLLSPLAELAPLDRRATLALAHLLAADPEPPVRHRAAELAPAKPDVIDVLLRSADDPEVRVREAAIDRLGEHRVAKARAIFLRHLEGDRWPLVRAASIRALRALEPTSESLQVLARSAEDDLSAEVRRPAVLALGTFGSRAHTSVVRDVFELDQDVYVQASAAAALGLLCDREMTDVLTKSAVKLATYGASERDGILARASLGALGRLNPPDLRERLAPFRHPEAPVLARHAARAALEHPEPCSK